MTGWRWDRSPGMNKITLRRVLSGAAIVGATVLATAAPAAAGNIDIVSGEGNNLIGVLEGVKDTIGKTPVGHAGGQVISEGDILADLESGELPLAG